MDSPEGRIAQLCRDVKCMRCGYNLRTCRLDGVCPECGVAVWESLPDVVLTKPAPSRRWFFVALGAVYGPGLMVGLVDLFPPVDRLRLIALGPMLLPAVLFADRVGVSLSRWTSFGLAFSLGVLVFLGILHAMRESGVGLRRAAKVVAMVFAFLDAFTVLIFLSSG